jgi:glycyl-tRNA synthetase
MVVDNGGARGIEDFARFCKEKGFVYPSSEIYGGIAGFWDFGPLGIELFNNLKAEWWNFFVHQKENVVGMEGSIISHPRTWKASGHLDTFSDVAVVCKKCKLSTKIDKSELGKVNCENCGGEYEDKGEFNLMFKTSVGALKQDVAYLRGETAQGMFLDFKNINDSTRVKLPFGVAQIGRCFRNEIAPRDFIFRCREFHIAELEFFLKPDTEKCELLNKKSLDLKLRLLDAKEQDKGGEKLKETTIGMMLKDKKLEEWHAYWLAEQVLWFKSIGVDLGKIKVREHVKDELSHYSSGTFDLDYEFPFGSKEVTGNAYRGQYDLTQHEKESGKSMEIFDEASGKKILPRVIEPTFGMERVFLAAIVDAYNYDKKRDNVVLKLSPKIAPIKSAVFPIVKKDKKVVKIAREIFEGLKEDLNVVYDESGSVGRRYARQDEIGTPYCVTVDGDSLEDGMVTIRERDTTKQVRVDKEEIGEIINKLIKGKKKFKDLK